MYACVVVFQFPPANAAAGNYRPGEDRENISSPVEDTAAQVQSQDVRYNDMGYYNMANDHPPLREHRDHAISNYAGVVLEFPAQAQAAPPAPVCIDLTFPHTHT
jgi:hypothetical protein